jgi:hypothetical protein
MRIRSVLVAALAVIALAVGGMARVSVHAQDGPLASMGFPELAITLTDAGLEGVPAETAAGWYLVTFTNNITPTGDPFDDAWQVDFIQVPEGMTAEEIGAFFMAPPPGAEGEGEASPESMDGMDMASPAAEDPSAFLYETYMPGGPGALQGESGQGAVFLEPGDYAVLTTGLTDAVPMTVTGEADMAAAAITAGSTITEVGTSGSFDFEATLTEGPGVIEIYNDADQPHFIFAVHSDVPMTEDEVMALLSEEESAEGATPEAGAAAAEEPPISPGFITGLQSPETTQYVSVDLQPGYYILLCFVGDPEMDGLPHAFTGMIEVVPVGVDAGTPAA